MTAPPGVSGGRTGKHRIVRRHPLVVFVVALAVLLVVVDRVAAAFADHLIAGKIQHAEHLASSPDVTVKGFPLLTQVAAQRYNEVDVSATDLRRGDLVASALSVRLYGVQVATAQLLDGHVRRIPVDRADGTVRFSYADLDRMLTDRGVTMGYARAGVVRVHGTITVAGQRLAATATATLGVDGDDLMVAARSVDLGGGSLVSGALSSLAKQVLTFRLPLTGLPFGIHVDRVSVARDGVTAHAVSRGFVVDVAGH